MKTIPHLKKALLCLFVLLSFANKSSAQLPFNPYYVVDSTLRAIFSPLWHPVPGPDFLIEMSSHTLDTIYYTENNPDTIDRDIWFKIYQEMRNCKYDTTTMDPHDTVFFRSMQYNNDTTMFNILAFDYLAYNEDALTTDIYYDFDVANSTISDKVPRELDPYITRKVFAAAPSKFTIPFTQVTYVVNPAFIFRDSYNDFTANNWELRIDFGDGAGWAIYDPNIITYATITYPGVGEYGIKTEIFDPATGTVILSSISKVSLSKAQNKYADPDDWVNMPSLTAAVYNPCNASGGPMKKIIIYVEGYDPMDFLPGTNRNAQQIYSEQIESQGGLPGLSDLRNYGYTFVVVDWKQSGRAIEQNGMELVELLNYLKCQQRTIVGWDGEYPIEEATNEQFVIIGESMGGLVARYALCFMEKFPSYNPTWCLREKMHNTRLLLTFDSPHRGANIPISYQILYRNIGSFLLGANSITQAITGGISNLLIDATSVKEMLLYHVNSYNPASGTCSPDIARPVYLANMAALGNYPQYCKTMALSNGSMVGVGQPKIYDETQQRTPNDYFLNYNSDSYIRALGEDHKILHVDFKLRTTPAGSGSLNSMSATAYLLVPKITYMGTKVICKFPLCPFLVPPVIVPLIKFGFTTISTGSVGLSFNGSSMQPYDVIPGSYESYGEGVVFQSGSGGELTGITKALFFGFNKPTYNSTTNQYTLNKGVFGTAGNTTLYTDGLSFSYIPTFSSLHYNLGGGSYWHDITGDAMSTKLSSTPFDVICGNIDTLVHNQAHLFIRNEALGAWQDGVKSNNDATYFRHEDCTNPKIMMMLNREIGDDSLYIENRETNWTCIYDAEKFVGVNLRSPYYEYSSSSTSLTIPGVYSRSDNYVISAGTTYCLATGSSVTISGSYGSSLQTGAISWVKCCDDYQKGENTGIKPVSSKWDGLNVYPNPVTDNILNVEFNADADMNSSIAIYDLLGRKVLAKTFAVTDKQNKYTYRLSFDKKPVSGSYLVVVKNGNKQYKRNVLIFDRN